jgi:hypothetical protein
LSLKILPRCPTVAKSKVRVFHEEEGFTMNKRLAMGASLAVALLVGSAIAEETLKSGPQVGKTPMPFNPLHVTGRGAGGKQCLV